MSQPKIPLHFQNANRIRLDIRACFQLTNTTTKAFLDIHAEQKHFPTSLKTYPNSNYLSQKRPLLKP